MNYRLDADILFPVGSLDTRVTPLSRDYDAIFDRKMYHRLGSYNHYNAQSGRDKYMKQLHDSDLQVNNWFHRI